MNRSDLDDVLNFNQQIIRLAKAGLPIHVEGRIEKATPATEHTLAHQLERITATFAVHLSRGQSLADALKSEPAVPLNYRVALETWRRCQQTPAAFELLLASVEMNQEMNRDVRSAMTQPLLLGFLGYCGFLYLCGVMAPKMAEIYAQMWKPHAPMLSLLLLGTATLPIWSLLIPAGCIAAMVWIRTRGRETVGHWLAGHKAYQHSVQKANYASHLAHLLEKQFTLPQAFAITGPLNHFTDSTPKPNATAVKEPQVDLQTLPPLLRWALTETDQQDSQIQSLHVAATMYRTAAQRFEVRWRTWLPTVTGAAIGGLIVLFFGLSLFLPVVELMQEISIPEGI